MATPDPPVRVEVTDTLALGGQIALQSLGIGEGGVVLRLDSGEMYTVNDTTLAFLEDLDGIRSIDEVATRLLAVFDVEHTALVADLVEIAADLIAEQIVSRVR